MWLLFAILLFVLLIILIWQQIQHKELEREINYITDRLASLSITSDNGFVLIPTDNDSIKKLGDAPADLFYRYNDCVFTALYVDAKQTKGNGCADQYG